MDISWQKFIEATLAKIAQVKRMIDEVKPSIEIEVDGGIDPETAPRAVEAGATVLVAGSSIFGTGDSVEASMSRLLTKAAS